MLAFPLRRFIAAIVHTVLLLCLFSHVQAASPTADLLAAAEKGDVGAIKRALASKVNVNRTDSLGWSPLLLATTYGNSLEAVELLVAAGADVNASSRKGETPLMGAALSGNEAMVRLLLAKGARKAAKSASGLTARDFAERKGHMRVAVMLGDASDREARIPTAPIGDPARLQLANGLTLFDWMNQAEGRIDRAKPKRFWPRVVSTFASTGLTRG